MLLTHPSATTRTHRYTKTLPTPHATDLGFVFPEKLSFHPSHHPHDFLSVPEWSYGRSKCLSFTRIKLSLPPIKPLRVAPKPPAKAKTLSLELEGTQSAPNAKDMSASGDARAAGMSDKEMSVLSTSAEAINFLTKCETKDADADGDSTGAHEKVDPLDDEFSQYPFLDSLRCVFVLMRPPLQQAA